MHAAPQVGWRAHKRSVGLLRPMRGVGLARSVRVIASNTRTRCVHASPAIDELELARSCVGGAAAALVVEGGG